MKVMLVTTVAAMLILAGTRTSSAQDAHGFVIVGAPIGSVDYGSIGGGLVFDLANGWLSAGGQGDLLIAFPYFAGRGGPIAQVNFVRTSAVRLFASGGYGWGEEGGPMVGAGIELAATRKIAFRATVHDYVARWGGPQPYIAHRPGLQLGIAWR